MPAVSLLDGGVSLTETVVRDGLTPGSEMAPQVFEKSRFAPGNGMAHKASDPQDLRAPRPASRAFHPRLHRCLGTNDARFAWSGLAVASRPDMAPQPFEKF